MAGDGVDINREGETLDVQRSVGAEAETTAGPPATPGPSDPPAGGAPGPADQTIPIGDATLALDRAGSLPSSTPEKIGHYHLTRVIASGGMGTVYEAEQDQPRRTVALKVIKAGLASRSALRRFEYESQVLARLRHPGIAQVYEAGTHDDGTGGVPFFAMEFVPGAKILTEYAEWVNMPTRDRLELFIQVCEAVYHGHQKGVIHRDLKPANILVDGQGQPKIIDYGIARATDSDLAGGTLQTQVGDLVGTVQYMSPEQCEADPNDIDTRSDVYGLGVVLYELLTNKLPYDVSNVAIFEATRIIRERSPTPLGPIRSELKGDIETITLKALEKDRERRYQSAQALARDIRRFLDDEPIQARPPSLTYQLKRFAKRNKVVVGAAGAVAAALLFSFVGITYFLFQARSEAATANAITAYFQQMFGKLNVRDGGASPKEAKIADMLVDVAEDLQVNFLDKPQIKAELHWSIGNGFRQLTDFAAAEEQLRLALDLQRETLGEPHVKIAQTLEDLSAVRYFRDGPKESEAERFAQESLEMRERLFDAPHEELASAHNYLAAALLKQHRFAEAEHHFRQALRMRESLGGDNNELVARSLNNLGLCLRRQGEYHTAFQLHERAVSIIRSLHGNRHYDVAGGEHNMATCLVQLGEPEEAERRFRLALDIKEEHLRPEDERIARTRYELAKLLHQVGKHAEAEQRVREVIEIIDHRDDAVSPRPANRWVVNATELLGKILRDAGAYERAEPVWTELIELRAQQLKANAVRPWQVAVAQSNLGECLSRLGRMQEAESILLSGYRGLDHDEPNAVTERKLAKQRLYDHYMAWDRPEDAREYEDDDEGPTPQPRVGRGL